MSEVFDLRRIGLLIRADLIAGYRTLLLVSAALAGVIMLTTLYLRIEFYFGWFAAMLVVWGLILTSRAFRDLYDKTRNTAFLLLPASALEKTVARLLLISVGFVAYLLAFTTLVSLLCEGVNWLVYGRREAFFQPLEQRVWVLAGNFVVVQSVFFLGAAWFRKSHLVKTVLALVVTGLGLGALGMLIGRLVLGPYTDGEVMLELVTNVSWNRLYTDYGAFLDAAELLAALTYFVALPLFCWTVAWLRVRETQVSDGV